ncbi:hypothetical protein Trydic_g8605 [Trypoxylus dichotomus]
MKRRSGKTGLRVRVTVRKSSLREQNKWKRYEWAQVHKNLTIEDWKKVLWSDESKFEVYSYRDDVYSFEGRQENERQTSAL